MEPFFVLSINLCKSRKMNTFPVLKAQKEAYKQQI